MNKNNGLYLSLALLCSFSAAADTTMRFNTSQDSGQPGAVYLTDGKLRVGDSNETNWVLYDQRQDTLFIIDEQNKSYHAFDQAQIDAMGKTLGAVSDQLEAALAELPPAQRAQARAMMESMLPEGTSLPSGDAAAEFDVAANYTGQYDNVAGIRCEIVETSVNGKPENELCIASADALELSRGEIATLESMADFAQKMLAEITANAGSFLPADFSANGIVEVLNKGVPVRMVDKTDNSTASLESISHGAVDGALLQIPADYAQESLNLDF